MGESVVGAEIDHAAPPLDLRPRGGRIALSRFAGQPVVLAIFDAWHPGTAALEHIRALLRGLGAALVVVSESVWCFGPEDVELVAPKADLPRGAVEAVRRDWGVEQRSPRDGRFAVFVVDAKGLVRFARRDVVSRVPAEDALEAALDRAGRALRSPPRVCGDITHRELLDACLVAGFFAAIAACSRVRSPTEAEAEADLRREPLRRSPVTGSLS
jgi:hypothetical protein